MNIILTGATGQLGSEMLALLSRRGHVTCVGRSMPAAEAKDWREVDFSIAKSLDIVLHEIQPDLIVNAAAYTAVDKAETEVEAAYQINEKLPAQLAQWARQHDTGLIHYSTDYVFDGESRHAYAESDATNPQSVYGQSKLAGEIAISRSGCRHVILRTAWIYSSHGKNFVLSMLNLARKGLDLKIVSDQVGSPTSARNLALVSDQIIEKWHSADNGGQSGIYHYRDDGTMSWFDFARAIVDSGVKSGLLENLPSLVAIPGSEFPQAAKRPEYSVLNCQKLSRDFGIQPYSFEDALKTVMDELSAV